jgi:tRNA (guanine-N7-)-methyltransferase
MDDPVRPFNVAAIEPPIGWKQFQWPESFLENGKPIAFLDMEIGCGVGWHPLQYSSKNPDRRLIAIEHTRAKFEKFQSRLARHPELGNLLPIHGDAIRWITHLLEPAQLERCMILYPNPEPKAPNKRWFRMPFMHRLIETLRPGGEILLATNEEWYWVEAMDWAKRHWMLQEIESRRFDRSTAPPEAPRTHFEKKYLQRGETCFDLRLRKP